MGPTAAPLLLAAALLAASAAPDAAHAERVLVVSIDMKSHVVTATKWALHLADAGHDVTVATPEGAAVALARRELDADPAGGAVAAVGAGRLPGGPWPPPDLADALRDEPDPSSWAALFNALSRPGVDSFFTSLLKTVQEAHEAMLAPLAALVEELEPDAVVADIPIATLVADAAELAGSAAPVVMAVPCPYDPRFGEDSLFGPAGAWAQPRAFKSSLPHAELYPPTEPPPGPALWARRAWLAVDAALEQSAAWRYNSVYLPERRALHGLPPLPPGQAVRTQLPWPGAIVSLGGGPPLSPPQPPSPPRVAAVGAIERPAPPMPEGSEGLASWLRGAQDEGVGVVLVSMGTAMKLSPSEAYAVASELGAGLAATGGPKLLWSLRAAEQAALEPALARAMGPARAAGEGGASERLNGTVRVEPFIPQRAVLGTGAVRLFVSHMGFGSFAEGVAASVPFLTYPGFSDQPANARRASEAGVGLAVPRGMAGVGALAREALSPGSGMAEAAKEARKALEEAGGGAAAARHIAAAARGEVPLTVGMIDGDGPMA